MGRKAVDPAKLMQFVDNPTPPPRAAASAALSPSRTVRGFGASGARLNSTQGAAFGAHMTQGLAVEDLPEVHAQNPSGTSSAAAVNPHVETDFLVHPQERRRRAEEAKAQHEAAVAARAEAGRANKAAMIERNRTRYPGGIMAGAEAMNVPTTDFGSKASEAVARRSAAAEQRGAARRSDLSRAVGGTGVASLLVDASTTGPASEADLRPRWTGKARTPYTNDAADRGNIIDFMNQPSAHATSGEARRQALRNYQTAGRSYDIISSAQIEYCKPSIPERVDKRKAHPSMMI